MKVLKALLRISAILMAMRATAVAQGSAPQTLTFDVLQAARAADSLRGVVAKQRSEIARLNKAASVKPVQRVDTVRAVDTVRVVDTVRIAPAPAAPGNTASAKASPAPAPAAPAPSIALPRFTGLLQLWLFGGDANYRSTVRVRRAELKVVSDLGRRARATLVFDVAKSLSLTTSGSGQVSVSQNSRELQDGFISMDVRHAQIDAGQVKIPLGLEGMQSSSSLESAERALMFSDRARGGSFGDIRDVGVVARRIRERGELHVGVFNGSGESQNEMDRNVGKSFVASVGVKVPGITGLQLGASGATAGKATLDKPTRDRVGLDVRFSRGAVLVQTEAMQGQDGITTRRGGYVLAAYSLTPRIRAHVRADGWDPDRRTEVTAATSTERDFALGTTWTPANSRLKLQAVGVHKTYTRNIVPAATQAIITIQAAW